MRFVPTQSVQIGMIVGRDIISQHNNTMITKGVILTDAHIHYLKTNGYMGIYVSDRFSEDVVIQDAVDPALIRKSIDAIAEENIGHILNFSLDIVREMIEQDDVSVDLIDLRSFDDYTYHHSVNVSVYAVAVGKKLGLSAKELGYLSQAAICHDLGKMHIPAEILNKPGRLTDEEYEIIKTHPRKSLDVLNSSFEVSAIVKQAVLMHHENENGSGYPLHKKNSELPILAKIIHAVDVYDALTSKRPYKDPYAPVSAFEYLKGGCDILFDRHVVEAMMQVLPAFPPGTEVTLSNQQKGIVIGHTAHALRPLVKLFEDGNILDLSLPEYDFLMITESGINASDYTEEVELLNETRNKAPAEQFSIMLVDDSTLYLNQTKDILLQKKYRVSTFSNGFDALKQIKTCGCPDLLIVDIEMPQMDGFAFVNALRGAGYTDVPFIFLTARADRETVRKCFDLNAADYILKPARPIYLQERVAYALKKYRE